MDSISTLIGIDHITRIRGAGFELEAAPAQFGAWFSDQQVAKLSVVRPTSFQAVFYGTNLNLFDEPSAWADHLSRVAKLAEKCGAGYLVIGGPKNRIAKKPEDTDMAFAGAVAQVAAAHPSVDFGIEHNPEYYGANICTTVATTAAAVRAVRPAAKNVWLHLDHGCAQLAGEVSTYALMCNVDIIKSVHFSVADLKCPTTTDQYAEFKRLAKLCSSLNKNRTLECVNCQPATIDWFSVLCKG